jgi:hypothetical protein
MGGVTAALFSPLAVLVLGRCRPKPGLSESVGWRLKMSSRQWLVKLSSLAAVYVLIYFGFGYFVAWQNPQVREYYGGAASQGVFQHLMYVRWNMPLLLPCQALRGLLWVGLAVPLLALMRGPWWETGIAIGLLFAVMMNAQLLLPNQFMPEGVRMIHLVETATSNFLFGFLISWTFRRELATRFVSAAGNA